MMRTLLDKLLGFTFLGDFAEWMNGKKTMSGVVMIVLWTLIYALPRQFPEYAFIAGIAERVIELLENLGVEGTEFLKVGFALGAIGATHKLVKKG